MWNTHNEMVSALVKPANEIHFTDQQKALIHATLGVVGEAGELADCVKKHVIYNQPLNFDNMIEEMGDLEFYLEDLRQRLGVSRELVLEYNKQKLWKRYGATYSDRAAQERADKK